MLTIANVVEFLERLAPLDLAADWDNVGLLLGDRAARVRRVLTCLTVTPDVAEEAVEAKVQLIVTHHPILFRPVKRLTASNPEGRLLLDLIRARVAVYSPHTAFDNTAGGINEVLARRLGLAEVAPLRRRERTTQARSASAGTTQAPSASAGTGQCKVVVFVPEADLARVSDAMFAAGAGHIGQYSQCSFRLAGTGTFFGSDASNPTVGRKGQREEVGEWRLEAVCPESAVERVIAAVRRAHSYEEPAYDVYPLRPAPSAVGEGRIGRLAQARPLREFAQAVKEGLGAAMVQTVGDPAEPVERVAVVCGAGGELLSAALRSHADVLLTGELRFHDYLAARAEGLALCLPGHYATERCGVEELAGRLQEKWPELEVWASRREHDPVTWSG